MQYDGEKKKDSGMKKGRLFLSRQELPKPQQWGQLGNIPNVGRWPFNLNLA